MRGKVYSAVTRKLSALGSHEHVPPVSRLTGSLLLFLVLSLVLFYGAWYSHKVTSNNLINLSGIMGGIASVLWAGHNMGRKASRKLDAALSVFIPHSRLTKVLTIAAALCLGVFIFLRVPWNSPVFEYIYLGFSPGVTEAEALAQIDKYLGTCAVVAFIAAVAILGLSLLANPPKTMKDALKRIGLCVCLWWGATVALAFENTLTIVVLLCVIGALALIGWALMSLVVSPFVLSKGLKEVAGGRSITVALVFVLCCLALVLFVSGLLMSPPPLLGPTSVRK